jgi:hypothetical protein
MCAVPKHPFQTPEKIEHHTGDITLVTSHWCHHTGAITSDSNQQAPAQPPQQVDPASQAQIQQLINQSVQACLSSVLPQVVSQSLASMNVPAQPQAQTQQLGLSAESVAAARRTHSSPALMTPSRGREKDEGQGTPGRRRGYPRHGLQGQQRRPRPQGRRSPR